MTVYAHDTVVPYKNTSAGKNAQVEEMFDDIAPSYDFLNRFLSAGIDRRWRKKAIGFLTDQQGKQILDAATGTADMALMMSRTIHPQRITGIDISEGMLMLGRDKIAKAGVQNIFLQRGNAEDMHFSDESFDAATVAFGVRNFQSLEKGLSGLYRVLRPGGKLVVLEFSKPCGKLVGFFYKLYMKMIAARVGRIVSKNKTAYEYLDESISKFPEGKDFLSVLAKCGFSNGSQKKLTFGICSIYCATK